MDAAIEAGLALHIVGQDVQIQAHVGRTGHLQRATGITRMMLSARGNHLPISPIFRRPGEGRDPEP